MKCKDCNEEGCPYRAYTNNAECLYTPCREIEETSFDWQSFRAEAAKDILCQVITLEEVTVALTKARVSKERAVSIAISYADELIRQLKEREKK